MIRFIIACSLVSVLGTIGLAQEEKPKEQQRSAERRNADRGRRRYEKGRTSVKDPAGFKLEGKQIFSGPQPGEKLPACTAVSIIGDNKGKELDIVDPENKGLQVLIFQDESGVAIRGLFGVADAIGKIDRNTKHEINAAVVFLADDEQKINQFARLFPRLVERGLDSIAFSKDGREGPGTYGLDRTVSQTVILSKDGKVSRNFVFPQGMLYADPHVLGGIAELIDEDLDKVASWLAAGKESGETMRRGDGGGATPPAAFRRKIGEFVRAGKITREEAAELYEAAFPKDE